LFVKERYQFQSTIEFSHRNPTFCHKMWDPIVSYLSDIFGSLSNWIANLTRQQLIFRAPRNIYWFSLCLNLPQLYMF
jgi:hypothetical protein